ncbi:O-antigen ligase family protein [Sphingomonas sp. LB-2]|nr:O-antigen ligase family protein [Sphingomonas caeni]
MAAFVALVFLTGGGSRDDVASLVILRPACAFFAAYALTAARPGDFARLRVPILLLVALGGWMILQLIPLPHGLWSALPGRAAIAANDQLAGLGEIWRPISLAPSKTMNALGSLIVPITALMLYAIQAEDDRRRLLPVFLIVATVSALFSLGQYAMGSGPLYLYRMTNIGEAVGLFANRNHNAVFLATTLLIAAWLLTDLHRLRTGVNSAKPILYAAAALLVIAILLINRSRAGLLIGLLAIGLGVALYLTGLRRGSDAHAQQLSPLRWLPIAGVIGVSALGAAALFANSGSFDRLVSLSVAEELRAQVLPQIIQMAKDHWVFGTGFGSFEYVYRSYETSQFLREEYLNNAHDDWLQWIIEGGLPAILIALGFMGWLAGVVLGHWRARLTNLPRTQMAAMALGVLLLLLLASALDYPLRVPSMMLYAVLMVAFLADTPEPAVKIKRRSGGGRA